MSAGSRQPAASARLAQLVAVVVALAAAGAALAWVAISVVHLDDRHRVGHVQGAWMGLARYVNEGTLYPPLFDGERYGGTRWMPLGIVLHALSGRLLGSELVGGKVLTLVTSVILLGVAMAVLRRLGCPWPLAAGLLTAVIASEAGLFATTTIGADVLPVVLQVGALLLFLVAVPTIGRGPPSTSRALATKERDEGTPGRRGLLIAAGVLAGLSPLAKITGGWAVLAILSSLVAARRWGDLRAFLAAVAVTAIAGLAVVWIASGGRLWGNVGRLLFAGDTGVAALVRAPNQLVFNVTEFAPGFLAIVPLGLLALALVRTVRELSVVDWALAWATLALLTAFTDIGTGFNQLLDVLVLLVLAAAQVPHRLGAAFGGAGRDVGVVALGVAALAALAAGVVVSLVPAVRTAVDAARHGYPRPTVPLSTVLEPDVMVLSEDPYVPVALGRDPVVLDAFMLRRLDAVEPHLVDPLIERIEGGAFDYLVLVEDLATDDWWERYHFGLRVVEAMRQAYEPIGEQEGYLLYRPRE